MGTTALMLKCLNFMARKKKEQKPKDADVKDQAAGESETQVATEETAKDPETEIAELKDKNLRLFAEFDNFKKRTNRERLELIRTSTEDLVQKLLPVLDDFDRAKKTAEDSSNDETFSEGVQLVYNKLYQILEARGLEPMDTDEVDFDPELHEAITKIPAPNEDLKGKIIDHIEKGYYLNDKIIRHAKVVIGD